MMERPVTVVITPRDRYSELAECVRKLYAFTDEALFELLILDLGYPKNDLAAGLQVLEGRSNYRVIDYGMIIPMDAMRRVRSEIKTPYAVFMDNDSRVTEGWLPPLIAAGDDPDVAVMSPVVLEASGVDEGADLRTHLFTTELRVVDVEDDPYLVEYKTYRRSPPEDLPQVLTDTEAFELHCVMFRTDDLNAIELPYMTIREHLDIGMQLRAKGKRLVVVPQSEVIFDNLGTRAKLSDLRYFNLRWNGDVTGRSSRLFERRWGFKFYSEEAIYLWAVRRRVFLLLRWMYAPVGVANKVDRALGFLRRRFAPVWDPLPDAEARAVSFYERYPGAIPEQLDHATD